MQTSSKMFLARMFQQAHLGLAIIALLSFLPALLAQSVQTCGLLFAPAHGFPGVYSCRNPGGVTYTCKIDSCHQGGHSWADFTFTNCLKYNTDNSLSNIPKDRIWVESLVVIQTQTETFVNVHERRSPTWYKCTWSKEHPFNSRRPQCNSCDLVKHS
ncbi:hypothetical protein H4Q26_000021 [Puccinia striiformis f. sp. tritici PST-130]|nr:hypothetical protein H4Q26_000021 [Puccinia striiformis f. sp. tritici PST-130]